VLFLSFLVSLSVEVINHVTLASSLADVDMEVLVLVHYECCYSLLGR